jgi:hypothetical protein
MGFGGYDVYTCSFDGTGWGTPKNMSRFINSGKDEIGFSIHHNRKIAVFSTDAEEADQKDEILLIELNNSAFVDAGISTENQDISLLLQDMVRTGFTSAKYGATSKLSEETGFSLTSLPLIYESSEEPEPESPPGISREATEPEEETTVPVVVPVLTPVDQDEEVKTEPDVVEEVTIIQPIIVEEPEAVPEQAPVPGPAQEPDQVVFRIQITSTSRANTSPSVTIAGSTYRTWEYYYKGAYRITVGEFTTLQEALSFRTKCKNSGYDQAFVAAFRGNERVTDPSVFKK